MGVWNFFISSLFISVISAEEFVPVLLWGTQSNTHQTVPGLSRLSTDEFRDYLLKKVKVEKPLIVVFMEENISVEDFSWRDVDENGAFPLVSNITKLATDVSFLPSVHNPYRALKMLRENGYSWELYSDNVDTTLQDEEAVILLVKLQEPKFLEDRPDMLRNHDKQMAEVFSKILKWKSNVLAVYTGHHCSWIDAEIEYNRVKRETETREGENEGGNASTLVIADKNKTIILVTTSPIAYFDGSDPKNPVNITQFGVPTIDRNDTNINLDVNFILPNKERVEVDFMFTGSDTGTWQLTSAKLNEDKEKILKPTRVISGPRGYSYYCSQTTELKLSTGTGNDKKTISLIFQDLQIQPYVKNGKFGSAIDCIPFFSTAIWSGIFIVFLLSMVSAWGILMIMDINTMDRFDDPKGKTITITATD